MKLNILRFVLTFFSCSGFFIKTAELYLKDRLDSSYKYAHLSGAKTLLWKSSELVDTAIKTPKSGQIQRERKAQQQASKMARFQMPAFLFAFKLEFSPG